MKVYENQEKQSWALHDLLRMESQDPKAKNLALNDFVRPRRLGWGASFLWHEPMTSLGAELAQRQAEFLQSHCGDQR